MGYTYGKTICRGALIFLSAKIDLSVSLEYAYAEIRMIQEGDVDVAYFRRIQDWREKYLSLPEFWVSQKGVLAQSEREVQLQNLADELAGLCNEIIMLEPNN